MNLRADIDKYIESSKRTTKADKLLEVKEDIEYMLDNKLSLSAQIEILLRNGVVDKLQLKEYRNILIKHFGYQPKSRQKQTIKQISNPKSNPPIMKSAKEILSQEISLT